MAQLILRYLLVAFLVGGFFGAVWSDFHGRPERKANGFAGFIGSCIAYGLVASLFYAGGAFNLLTGSVVVPCPVTYVVPGPASYAPAFELTPAAEPSTHSVLKQ